MKFDEDQTHGKSAIWLFSLVPVEIDACPIYEFLISLDIVYDTYHGDETYEAGKAWFATLRCFASVAGDRSHALCR